MILSIVRGVLIVGAVVGAGIALVHHLKQEHERRLHTDETWPESVPMRDTEFVKKEDESDEESEKGEILVLFDEEANEQQVNDVQQTVLRERCETAVASSVGESEREHPSSSKLQQIEIPPSSTATMSNQLSEESNPAVEVTRLVVQTDEMPLIAASESVSAAPIEESNVAVASESDAEAIIQVADQVQFESDSSESSGYSSNTEDSEDYNVQVSEESGDYKAIA